MITEKSGRPPKGYSNLDWQKDFTILKEKIQKSKTNIRMPVIAEPPFNPDKPYYGKTQYQYYCDFINDILDNIRRGGTDYCFYIYQIADLLKYEHKLNAIWSEKYEAFILTLNK